MLFRFLSDLEDKFSRKRDRYSTGMVQDFEDLRNYKPDFKLEYNDEKGRRLNAKEAFRDLSHRFHGKGSGKLKTEKRKKKLEQESVCRWISLKIRSQIATSCLVFS